MSRKTSSARIKRRFHPDAFRPTPPRETKHESTQAFGGTATSSTSGQKPSDLVSEASAQVAKEKGLELAHHYAAGLVFHSADLEVGKASLNTLKAQLEEQGLEYSGKMGVHPQTLTAFVKEQVESGAEFPLELFNVYIGQIAKIKRSK